MPQHVYTPRQASADKMLQMMFLHRLCHFLRAEFLVCCARRRVKPLARRLATKKTRRRPFDRCASKPWPSLRKHKVVALNTSA